MNTSSDIENFTLYEYDHNLGVVTLNENIEEQKNMAAYKRIASQLDPQDFPDE